MDTTDLTLRDLNYVLAVARHESFSVAAIDCQVSQPALSKQIKNLEIQLGMPLFERNKRQVRLTDGGRRFVEQARRVMDEASLLLQIPNQTQGPLSGRFQLGAIASVCPYLLPRFVGNLKTNYPDLRLMVKEGLTDPLVLDLKQGRLDAIIAATTFEDDLLRATPLFFEPFLLASRREVDSPIESPTISVQDIDPARLLLLEDGHCLKDQTVELCSLKGQGTELNFKATSLETLLQMTAGGLGIAVVPALARSERSHLNDNLTFSSFSNPGSGRVIALFTRKSYPCPANIQRLATFIRERLPESVQPLQDGEYPTFFEKT
jgi:LysR family hydrogen peroxide-inducible transcriptional activator